MTDNQTFQERLKILIKAKNMTNHSFEKKCGLGNAYVTSVGDTPNPKKIEQILNNFPDLNKEWLISGKGEMLLTEEKVIIQSNSGGINQQGDGNEQTITTPSGNSQNVNQTNEFVNQINESVNQMNKSVNQMNKSVNQMDESVKSTTAEIAAQRNLTETALKQLDRAQELLAKAQEQYDKLISIIIMQKGN